MIIQVRNTQLNVEDRGSGPVILLIHGFPLNLEIWRPQIEALSEQNRVIAVDLRGHGLSPATPGPFPMELLADDCAAVLTALGVQEPVVVCGLSMGGYVSFALYRLHPQLFSGMILAATRAGADSDQAVANREKAIAGTKQHGAQPVLDNMLNILFAPNTYQSNPELVSKLGDTISITSADGIVSALEGMKVRADSTRILDQIKVPTMIFHGADDQIITLRESEIIHSGITNSSLQIVPNAGHLLNLEQPEVFNDTVANFLSSI